MKNGYLIDDGGMTIEYYGFSSDARVAVRLMGIKATFSGFFS